MTRSGRNCARKSSFAAADMAELDKLDECAASLVRLYQKEGEFCIFLRTGRTEANRSRFNAIYPAIEPALVTDWVHRAAEGIFDGDDARLTVMRGPKSQEN